MDVLTRIEHRPWPLPRGPWVMAQRWHDLLFAHLPVDAGALRALVPRALELDTFEGRAWIGIVPFRIAGLRLRGLPPIPGTAAFPELNLRTYVVRDGKPGVWFFALDAASPLAVAAARAWFRLPYFRARMACESPGAEGPDGSWIRYASARTHAGAPPAELEARYRPIGEPFEARPGTIEHWWTERYCLYAGLPDGRTWRGEIHHSPWRLQEADARLERETLARAHGLEPTGEPGRFLFARRQDVLVWAPRRI